MQSYSLSELCSLISEALDECLEPSYWVKAEISSLSEKSGHMYLDLVELKANSQQPTAKMRATCWAGTKEMLMAYFEAETGQHLQAGMAVLVEAEVQYHPVYGLSLSIVGIDPSFTIGNIALQRQQTIAQLEKDGLLDAQQLLPLPTLIRNIAVISSASAAGYEDFCHQLQISNFKFHLTPFFATMQGEGAEKSIIAALEEISQQLIANSQQPFDIVVIIRGGGATTDLSCFDNYTLCAVCAQFELPIITGIGHTRDVSVLDLVAHEALKTPTAVAEWLIHRMDEQNNRINDLLTRLRRTAERQILLRKHRIELLEQRLAACNPERIYQMGYSLLTKNGKVIRSVHELAAGDTITTHLADGNVQSTVTA
ncbi:MAG: exodeoxyribonuclease VII large subunit [Paludibacteraceae bacterium]|nr:exodeoxyribonuclease VII large subunit [Paludibacteraceae bacterium]